jgi:hypothetical protein
MAGIATLVLALGGSIGFVISYRNRRRSPGTA